MTDDMMVRPDAALNAEQIQVISTVVQQMMAPVMENIGVILKHNTEAMERIAATQQMMSSRISDLEKQVRLKTPMSRAQEKCVNDAIRARARELLDGKGYGEDKKAVTKLGGLIRRSILTRYGVNSLREAPAYDYSVTLQQVSGWNDLLAIRDVVKEARKREEMAVAVHELPSGVDGAAPVPCADDQRGQPGMQGDGGDPV